MFVHSQALQITWEDCHFKSNYRQFPRFSRRPVLNLSLTTFNGSSGSFVETCRYLRKCVSCQRQAWKCSKCIADTSCNLSKPPKILSQIISSTCVSVGQDERHRGRKYRRHPRKYQNYTGMCFLCKRRKVLTTPPEMPPTSLEASSTRMKVLKVSPTPPEVLPIHHNAS